MRNSLRRQSLCCAAFVSGPSRITTDRHGPIIAARVNAASEFDIDASVERDFPIGHYRRGAGGVGNLTIDAVPTAQFRVFAEPLSCLTIERIGAGSIDGEAEAEIVALVDFLDSSNRSAEG